MRRSNLTSSLCRLILTRSSLSVEKLVNISIGILICALFESSALPVENPEVAAPGIMSEQLKISRYEEAKGFLEKRKWREAIDAFQTLYKADSKSIDFVFGLSTALVYSGQREEAVRIIIDAIHRTSEKHRLQLVQRLRILSRTFLANKTFQLYQDGLNLLFNRRAKLAREKFERASVEEPDNVEILVRLGQACYLESDYSKAVEYFKMAAKQDPFDPGVQLWLGRANFLTNFQASNNGGSELRSAAEELGDVELATLWLAEFLIASAQTASAQKILAMDVNRFPFHFQTRLLLAKTRIQNPSMNIQHAHSAKRDLNLLLSQVDSYSEINIHKIEGEWAVDLRKSPSEYRSEIEKLIQIIQTRVKESKKFSKRPHH